MPVCVCIGYRFHEMCVIQSICLFDGWKWQWRRHLTETKRNLERKWNYFATSISHFQFRFISSALSMGPFNIEMHCCTFHYFIVYWGVLVIKSEKYENTLSIIESIRCDVLRLYHHWSIKNSILCLFYVSMKHTINLNTELRVFFYDRVR